MDKTLVLFCPYRLPRSLVALVGLDPHRWVELWSRVSSIAREADPFDQLQRRYAEPVRHYHNAQHIVACLRLFDEVTTFVADPLALELAIWFHDAVYDSRAPDNEERSAQLAAEAITRVGGSPELAARVRALVLATKSHQPGREPDAPWLLDIDLAILGQPVAVFDAYEAAIRAEYAWVEPAVFAVKRAEVLRAFLAREQIFLTAHFRVRFEAAARRNLQMSVARLASRRA